MPPKIDSGLRSAILTYGSLNFFSRKIVAALKERNLLVSRTTVIRVLDEDARERAGYAKPEPSAATRGIPTVRTKVLVAKVKKAMTGPNPQSQVKLAKRLQVSARTIRRVIHHDLEGILKKKYRVHALSDSQVLQRLDRGPRFLDYIKGKKWRFIITVDEAWVYLSHTNGIRQVYYEFKGERTEESWTKFWKESHPKCVMFVGGVCNRGVTKIRFVEPGAKINSDYYIKEFLEPLFAEDISRLYPGEEHKVVFHQDSTPAHASRKTQKWLENSGIKFIPAKHWMGNSPDLAPMDYCVNGIFKWALFDREANTITGLKRVMKSVWSKLSQETINNALKSWQERVRLMIELGGHHIEHRLSGGKKFCKSSNEE